jgi:hypothetical protein
MIHIPDESRDWKAVALMQQIEINTLKERLEDYRHIVKEMTIRQDGLVQELEQTKIALSLS